MGRSDGANIIIDVDGIMRPKFNSDGVLIHSNDDGIRNFWKWFGDSRMTDEQGRPIVVYHGTFSDIHEFSPQDTSSFLGRGIYFTDNRQDANRYGLTDVGENPDLISKTDILQKSTGLDRASIREMLIAGGGKVYPLFVTVKNPIELTNDGLMFKSQKIDFSEPRIRQSLRFDGLADEIIDLMARQIDRIVAGNKVLLNNLVGDNGTPAQGVLAVFRNNNATRAIREIAITVGADGIILGDKSAPLPCFEGEATHIVAFNSGQIKSAIGNSGAFDPDSCDLSDAGSSLFKMDLGGDDSNNEVSFGLS